MVCIFIKFEKIDKKGSRFDRRQNTQLKMCTITPNSLKLRFWNPFMLLKLAWVILQVVFDPTEETPIFAKTPRKVNNGFLRIGQRARVYRHLNSRIC